jgi:hypothetical protein
MTLLLVSQEPSPDDVSFDVLIRALAAQLVFDRYRHADYSQGGAVCKRLSAAEVYWPSPGAVPTLG